jgi:hypothetical protein
LERGEVRDGRTDGIRLHELAKSRFPEIRSKVAAHANVEERTLRQLADDRSEEVVHTIANNRRSPPSLLHALASRGHRFKRAVVENLSTGPDNLALYFNPKDKELGRQILSHPNCPTDTLVAAARGKSIDLKRYSARHPNLAHEPTLRYLAAHQDNTVRSNVARNPNLTDELFAKLECDDHPQVRNTLKYENWKSSEEVLIQGLIEHGDSAWVRATIAKHPNLSNQDWLEKLARDENYVVRCRVARNPNLTERIVRRLQQDDDPGVRRAAKRV